MTVPYRSSFEKVVDNIYVNNDFSGSREEIISLIEYARERVGDFFGDLQCVYDTIFIICDNDQLLSKLGGDHDTRTMLFPSVRSYVSISDQYLDVNILAHELTHAELHSRLSAKAMNTVPVWFDEGLALQNDYREQYGEETWIEQTDNGKNSICLEDMDERSEFYAGTAEDRRFRYLNAKHEVSEWIENHKQQGLLELLDKLNRGIDFHNAYSG